MSDPLPAICKVEDALIAQVSAWPALAGWTVTISDAPGVALEEGTDRAITVFTTTYSFDQSNEQGQTIHTALIEFEAVSQTQAVGTIARANHVALANVMSALASDRHCGGRLQDIQEIDVAPAGATGKDAGGASLQVRVQFFTPRDDWFSIIGMGGQHF